MDPLAQEQVPESLFKVSYEQRWDLLRPAIERLYVQEGRRLPDVGRLIKDWCGFTAM